MRAGALPDRYDPRLDAQADGGERGQDSGSGHTGRCAIIDPGAISVILAHREVHEAVRDALVAHSQAVCDNIRGDQLPNCDSRAVSVRKLVVARVVQFLAIVLGWPRVSVVTPTWKRRDLLLNRCVPSVEAQDYQGAVEHVIVSDGPDSELPPLDRLVMMREHRELTNRGVLARRHGTEIADGDVIAYLDDDNSYRPQHLGTLVRALVDSGADFAYSRALCHGDGFRYSVGVSPPVFAQIDTSLIVHRRGLLGVANWQPSIGPADWDLVKRWMRAGAKWAFVPEITLDYYVNAGDREDIRRP